ncbi:MAG TPA: 3'(2'),5'-bisphosphate nucleotidase CysQ [Minicystis sp.]|nr:3'(2'),5'-bisphosphate nucleotidase CysQ [Minicystis sp.]
MNESPNHEIERVIEIARAATAVVRGVYESGFDVELKGPNDPVTRADREANALICSELARAFPADAVVAEESAPTSQEEIARLVAAPRVWFVDPLDGTREFTERIGEFAVMIGLAVGGKATLGVVPLPTTGELLVGRVGAGAFVEAADGTRTPLAVSKVGAPAEATLMVSRSHRPPVVAPFTAALGITRLVPCGSVGVKVSRIANGSADLYVHGARGAKRWDTCAPEAILVAAGGRFTDLRGEPIDYARPTLAQTGGILASNALLFDAARAVTRTIEDP